MKGRVKGPPPTLHMNQIWGKSMMKTEDQKYVKYYGDGLQGSCGDDGGSRRRYQVGDVDDHRRRIGYK